MLKFNKYDNLKSKIKKERDKIERRNTRDDNRVKKLQSKIQSIKYKRNNYCRNHNDKIKDFTSLLNNEFERINRDASDKE